MIPVILIYGGGRSIVVDGNRDIRRVAVAPASSSSTSFRSPLLVFLGGQSEELDQSKAHRRRP
jgi:hypothetical protein